MQIVSFAVLAFAASIVSAQAPVSKPPVSITSPLTGTTYTAGQKAILSWVSPSVDAIPQIVLAQGQSTALQPVTTIATNVSTTGGSYTWDIPADFPPANNYAFELGSSPNIAFTGLFEIKGPNGETGGNNTNAATYAAGANATPAASGAPPAASPASGNSGSSGSGGSGSSIIANTPNSGQMAGSNGGAVVKSDATKVNVAGALAVAAGIASVFMF
ncbi:hypothetical protein INT44_000862 [Umbelopsis vinacea]|uniref:Yeast cell wall synthesis Kre9/Knh1-like N-terminal domain-containing protein n=1 Tax=Umbelopsis vinacea TaxID=44442 RepID=A0A8H7Q956_9FUNG|nr:hypothetical protein INT44_000862 [Umbelopsis vinacea]KAI9289516.1 hypothetical protein BC943DRAFT_333862 [Umbelopsis sp. AD052]